MSLRRLPSPLTIGVLAIAVSLVGCLPIPLLARDVSGTRLNIDSTVPEFIVLGKTTRADVLLNLGEPDGASEHAQQFVYTRVSSKGGIAFVGAGAGGVGAGSTERMIYRRLVITFDDQGVVSTARMDTGSCWEKSLQGSSSPACADVRGRDATSLDTIRTGDVGEARSFLGFYWYPGVQGFQSFRGVSGFFSMKGVKNFQKHTAGSLVVGSPSFISSRPRPTDRRHRS